MRRIGRLLLPFLAFVPPATAGIAVREAHGRIDVAAQAAPLADVLDRLAKQTGMKIVYEGPAPRQLITLALVGRSAPEAVTAILEGQGLNYALILDATATRVETLLVTGAATPSGPRPARPVTASPPRYSPPPEPEPEPDDLPEEPPPTPEPPPPGPDKAQPAPNAPLGPNGLPLPPGVQVVPPGMAPPVVPVLPAPPGAGPFPQPTPTPPATPP